MGLGLGTCLIFKFSGASTLQSGLGAPWLSLWVWIRRREAEEGRHTGVVSWIESTLSSAQGSLQDQLTASTLHGLAEERWAQGRAVAPAHPLADWGTGLLGPVVGTGPSHDLLFFPFDGNKINVKNRKVQNVFFKRE